MQMFISVLQDKKQSEDLKQKHSTHQKYVFIPLSLFRIKNLIFKLKTKPEECPAEMRVCASYCPKMSGR